MDPRDPRAFGYIYNTTDDRHQFWAIKTERLAHTVVFAIKDLFEEAYKHMSDADKAEIQAKQTISTTVSPDEVTVSMQVKVKKISFVFKDFFAAVTVRIYFCFYTRNSQICSYNNTGIDSMYTILLLVF
jgi:hypothetical protein